MTDKTAFQFDLIRNQLGGLVLFIYRRDGKPNTASFKIEEDGELFIFTRKPDEVLKGVLDTHEARQAVQSDDNITIIELDKKTPENTLTYILPIQK